MSAEDRVKTACARVFEDGWAEAEIDKLDAWRRAVLIEPEEAPDES